MLPIKSFFVSVIIITGLIELDVHAQSLPKRDIPHKTGNMSVFGYHVPAPKGFKIGPPDKILQNPEALSKFNMTGIEDYVTFNILEPVKGNINPEPYLTNAKTCRKLGIDYAIYPWVHFYPDWIEQEQGFTPYKNLENGQTCRQPSGWAPHTKKMVEHFYRRMAKVLGPYVEAVYVTDCAEYGELGYPNGYTKWLRKDDNAQKSWWCGDQYARQDFRNEQLKKHATLHEINQNWGTAFESEQQIDYPPLRLLKSNPDPRKLTPQQRRWILDFIYWYQDASARRMKDFITIAQEAFPGKPCEIKLGHADEAALMGHNYSSACRILKGTKQLDIRSTHASVSYFHVKRVATPARFYGFTGFLTEPPGTVKPEKIAGRFFTDACAGVTACFDYMQNPLAAGDNYLKYLELLDGQSAPADIALFFPEADHYLRIDNNYPQALMKCSNYMRDVADYDVVDERLIADGALNNYSLLIIPGEPMIEQSTWKQLSKAIGRKSPLRIIQICESEPILTAGEFTCIDGRNRKLPAANSFQRIIGQYHENKIIRIIQYNYAYLLTKRGIKKDEIDILTKRDGILTGLFEHRILAYNTSDKPVIIADMTVPPKDVIEIKRRK